MRDFSANIYVFRTLQLYIGFNFMSTQIPPLTNFCSLCACRISTIQAHQNLYASHLASFPPQKPEILVDFLDYSVFLEDIFVPSTYMRAGLASLQAVPTAAFSAIQRSDKTLHCKFPVFSQSTPATGNSIRFSVRTKRTIDIFSRIFHSNDEISL